MSQKSAEQAQDLKSNPSFSEVPTDRPDNCENCLSPIPEKAGKFCSKCGFPALGSDREKENFRISLKRKKEILAEAEKKIRNVKILLYVLAGLNLAVGLVVSALSADMGILFFLEYFIAAAVFTACAIWVNKNPIAGVIAAFSFYMLLQIAAAIVDPSTIFQGIIVKVIFIGMFIKGIRSAYDYKEYAEKLKAHGA